MEPQIGPYYLLKTLGSGGMGTLWRARHKESGLLVAVKTLKTPSQHLAKSLRREIQALAQLIHPGIVRIIEEGIERGAPWYAMEMIEGQTLREWSQSTHNTIAQDTLIEELTRTASELSLQTALNPEQQPLSDTQRPIIPLTPERLSSILHIIRRLCAPLAYLHGEGFIHRDLKPDNILIRPKEEPVLLDFGLARSDKRSKDSLQVEQGISGTVYYMSPEQIQGEPLDARTDLYSLGVILFELLCGRRPFEAPLPLMVIRAHLQQEPPRLSSLVHSIPPALDQLVHSLLAKDRNDRPGYAEDISRELSALGAERSIYAGPRPRLYLYRPSFIGRAPLVQSLQRRLSQLQDSDGGLFFVEGARGVGKTRFAAEFAHIAIRKRVKVLVGECQPRQDGLGLNGLRRPLQEIEEQCRELDAESARQIIGRHIPLLSLYHPSLATLLPNDSSPMPPELPPELAMRRLFASLAEVLYAFCGESPMLLILDDLQWADPLTINFLRFLSQGGPLSRWLLVLGLYQDQDDRLRGLLSSEAIEKHQMGPLSEEETEQMAKEMLSINPPRAFLQNIHQRTKGNPSLYTEQLMASIERGVFRRDATGKWFLQEKSDEATSQTMTNTLEAVLRQRLSGVSEAGRALLSVLSVFEREVPSAVLEKVISLDAAVLQDLSRRQLLTESKDSWRFSNDALRELCYSVLSNQQRQPLHRAAAIALESSYSDEERSLYAASLARHWHEAQEPALARRYYLEGARRATKSHLHQEAERLYHLYLGASATADEESVCAHNELGERVFYLQGRLSEAAEEHERAIQEAQQLSLLKREAESLRLLGLARWRQGRVDEAELHYKSAMSLAQQSQDTSFEAILWRNLASLQHNRGELERALVFYERALSLLKGEKDRAEEGKCLGNLAVLYHDLGRLDDAYELYSRALVRHREANELRLEGICVGNLASLHQQRGALTQASECYERAHRIAREVGDIRVEALCLTNLGILACDMGQLTRARNLLMQALHMHRAAAVQSEEGRCLRALASLDLWEKNDLARAEELCQQSEVCITRGGDKLKLANLWCLRGHLCLAHGESAEVWLGRAKIIALELQTTDESELAQKIVTLSHAQEDFKRDLPLFRGHRVEDIPAPLKQWLIENQHL